jgi:regulator of protease activity HflC (stomatin/prohibitin superfamily)
MFLGLLIMIIGFLFSGIHKIEEGFVGVYYYKGILQKKLSYPGYNFMIPLITKVESV